MYTPHPPPTHQAATGTGATAAAAVTGATEYAEIKKEARKVTFREGLAVMPLMKTASRGVKRAAMSWEICDLRIASSESPHCVITVEMEVERRAYCAQDAICAFNTHL